MRLPILNSVRAWARLFHVSASRGLRHITAEPQSAQGGLWNSLVGGGRRYVTLAKWVTEVGHWPPCGANFCSAKCFFDNYIYTRYIKAQTTWIGVLVHIFTFVIWVVKKKSSHLHLLPQLPTHPLFCNVVPTFPPEQALFLPPIAARARAGHEYFEIHISMSCRRKIIILACSEFIIQSNWHVVKYVLKILVVNHTYRC